MEPSHEIKTILEDVADNLFNKDPYYQMGEDMARIGGLRYSIDPGRDIGHRIGDLTLSGKPLRAGKKYRVAGWASVQPLEAGRPVWDVVTEYLRAKRTVRVQAPRNPIIKNVTGNAGYATI